MIAIFLKKKCDIMLKDLKAKVGKKSDEGD